jgi:hypothetical protein
MKKYKFTPDIWLTFYLENNFCVGRTIIDNDIEIVACVSENGEMKMIPYSKINNQKELKLLKDLIFTDYNSERRNIDFDTNTN